MLFAVCVLLTTSLMTYAQVSQSTTGNRMTSLAYTTAYNVGQIMEDVKILLHRSDDRSSTDEHHTSSITSPDGTVTQTGTELAKVPKPRDCVEAQTGTGLAKVFLMPLQHPVVVFCDQATDSGGWVVMMRRINNEFKFPSQKWQQYKQGFGNPTGSFWFGLENTYRMTYDAQWMLRVELEDWEGNIRVANYSFFALSSEDDGYRLYIDGYSGDAGDALKYHNGQRFSTVDRDNDQLGTIHCATKYHGAWWYNGCVVSCLTGEYINGGSHEKFHQGVYWRYWKGQDYSYKRALMMIRKVK